MCHANPFDTTNTNKHRRVCMTGREWGGGGRRGTLSPVGDLERICRGAHSPRSLRSSMRAQPAQLSSDAEGGETVGLGRFLTFYKSPHSWVIVFYLKCTTNHGSKIIIHFFIMKKSHRERLLQAWYAEPNIVNNNVMFKVSLKRARQETHITFRS
jgi:hypothetical protein